MAGYWRHVLNRIPLRYEPTLWSIVFPLGMYSVGSQFLGDIDHLPIVHAIGFGESWVALGAWSVTFGAMLVHLWRTVARPSRELAGEPGLRKESRQPAYNRGIPPVTSRVRRQLPRGWEIVRIAACSHVDASSYGLGEVPARS